MAASPLIVRGGEGEVLNVLGVGLRFLCRREDTGGAWSLMENVIPENAGPPPHRHPWDETYYVLRGEVEFEIEGRRQRAGAGDLVYAPAGVTHAFRGASKEPAQMLIFDAPAHAEAFFKEVDREVSQLPRDLAKLPGIGERHGVTFAQSGEK
jgi:quercetin dioxygenase-like cupin family protein